MSKPFARGAVVALSIAASPVLAQLQLEEVVVTAQKREQGLRDVPISIIAISGERIADAGINGLQELTLYTPNVKINSGSASPNLFVRGVGSGTNAGFEQSVGMFIDGVYSGRGALANVWAGLQLAWIPGALVGLARGATRPRSSEALVAAQGWALLLVAMVFFGEARLRVPYDPFLMWMALAAYAPIAERLYARLRRRPR